MFLIKGVRRTSAASFARRRNLRPANVFFKPNFMPARCALACHLAIPSIYYIPTDCCPQYAAPALKV